MVGDDVGEDIKKERPLTRGAQAEPANENLSTCPLWIQEKLAASGIPPHIAKQAGISFVKAEEAAAFLGRDFRKNPTPEAFRIPYQTLDGEAVLDDGTPYFRLRFRGEGLEGSDGKHRRYVQPTGSSPHIYIPPGLSKSLKRFPALIVTEGELKALSATAHGIPTVGLGGIQSWCDPEIRGADKTISGINENPLPSLDYTSPLHPELMTVIEAAKTAGVRMILVLGDSDGRVEYDKAGAVISGNPAVESAVRKLARAIQWQGGDIEVFKGFCPLPENPESPEEKQGLDDWIVANGAILVKEEILKLCRKGNRAIGFSEKAHLDLAKWFRQRYQVDGTPGLLRWREDFYRWTERRWKIIEDKALGADLHQWLDSVPIFDKKEGMVPPTRSLVENVWATLERLCHLPTGLDAPFLLSNPPKVIPRGRLTVLQNGVLDLHTRELHQPGPELFEPHPLPFPYDSAAICPEWEKFLESLWLDDSEAVELLQEWTGYLISGNTSHQKILFMVGPKRAGKGTVLKVLTGLLGRENVESLALGKIGSDFGLAALLGKTAGFFPDARLTGGSDQGPIVETLLSISGEDALPVNRKHRDVITARIPARLVLCSNEIPRLQDASGALASRFLILKFTKSFFGGEDSGLEERLLSELPGIFLWALDGLDRLRERRRFIQPESGRTMMEDMHRLSSPVGAFVKDCCFVGPNFRVKKADLFGAWKDWAEANGHHPGSTELFSRNIQAAVTVQSYRPKDHSSHERPTYWRGIGLTTADRYGEPSGQPGQAVGQATASPQSGVGQGGSSGSGIFRDSFFEEEEDDCSRELVEATIGKHPDPADPLRPEPFSAKKQLDPPIPDPLSDNSIPVEEEL